MQDEVGAFLGGLVVCGLLAAWVSTSSKRRHELAKQRLDVLREALRHPTVDEATRAQLVRVLTRENEAVAMPWNERFAPWLAFVRTALFCVAWSVFLISAGMIAASAFHLVEVPIDKALPIAIGAFAMLTLHLAHAELHARRARLEQRA